MGERQVPPGPLESRRSEARYPRILHPDLFDIVEHPGVQRPVEHIGAAQRARRQRARIDRRARRVDQRDIFDTLVVAHLDRDMAAGVAAAAFAPVTEHQPDDDRMAAGGARCPLHDIGGGPFSIDEVAPPQNPKTPGAKAQFEVKIRINGSYCG